MSLIKCPECGKEISDKASTCIHCGFPLDNLQQPQKIQYYKVIKKDDKWVIGKPAQLLAKIWIENELSTGIKDLNVLASGITKDRAELLLNFLQNHRGRGEIIEDNECSEINQNIMDLIDFHLNKDAPLKCPRCKSTQITTGKRGFSMVTGFIGSNQTVNRCAKCGYSWKP